MKLAERIRRKIKRTLLDTLPDGFYFKRHGYCPCCMQETRFVSYHEWLRDNFVCVKCNSIPRERALIQTIEKFHPDWRRLAIHESSPSKNAASALLAQGLSYVATHYYPNDPLGSLVHGYRNEDLEHQTFPGKSFDLVVTQDVMEHVYSPREAFAEIARTLKDGGAHIFTVPIINKHIKSEVWATKGDDGSPVFLKTPEYHGNPIDPNGSPVTMHWGYDIVDFIEANSGLRSSIEQIDNLDRGIRAEYIEVIVSRK